MGTNVQQTEHCESTSITGRPLLPPPPPTHTQDNDHRVREGSHKALRACVEKVKSSLALQLRSIIGCWVAGMCDAHGPSATAARLAFDTAFTSKKQREVLEFGFKDVIKVTIISHSLLHILRIVFSVAQYIFVV